MPQALHYRVTDRFKYLLPTLASIGLFSLGYAFGRWTAPAPGSAGTNNQAGPASPARSAQGSGDEGSPGETAESAFSDPVQAPKPISADELRAMAAATDPDGRPSAVISNFTEDRLAVSDLPALIPVLATLEPSRGAQIARALFEVFAQQNSAPAWDAAASLPAGPLRNAAIRGVVAVLAYENPQRLLSGLGTIDDEGLRREAESAAFRSLASQDLDAALIYVRNLESSARRSDLLREMGQMPGRDPGRVFGVLVAEMPAGESFNNAVRDLVSNWALSDPVAAAAALASLPPGRAQVRSTNLVAVELARRGLFSEALAWSAELPAGGARQSAVGALFETWAVEAPAGAVSGISRLQPAERSAAIRGIAESWGASDPAAALRWTASLGDESERRSATSQVFTEWARHSPEAAAAALGQTEPILRGSVMRAVIDQWSSKDAEAAARWLATVPESKDKDSAVSRLSRRLVQEDPSSAIQWAQSISDEQARVRTLEQVARDWLWFDSESATSWIKSSGLPEQSRERLLR